MPRAKRATYLGTILTDENSNRTELMNRIAACTATANKLRLFWNTAKTEEKMKITVYNSVIRSKLLYGLECIELTQVEQDKLDAFQMAEENSTYTAHIYRSNANKRCGHRKSFDCIRETNY